KAKEPGNKRMTALQRLSARGAYVPILRTLLEYLIQVKRRQLTSDYLVIEKLFEQGQQSIAFLPEILRYAIAAGVDLELYSSLMNLKRMLEVERLQSPQVLEQKQWLTRA